MRVRERMGKPTATPTPPLSAPCSPVSRLPLRSLPSADDASQSHHAHVIFTLIFTLVQIQIQIQTQGGIRCHEPPNPCKWPALIDCGEHGTCTPVGSNNAQVRAAGSTATTTTAGRISQNLAELLPRKILQIDRPHPCVCGVAWRGMGAVQVRQGLAGSEVRDCPADSRATGARTADTHAAAGA